MAYIDNQETAKELVEAIRGNANTNLPPKILNNNIQPVIDINPKNFRRANIVRSSSAINSTSVTLYTTPTDKDFYLCGLALSVIKDVTATSLRSTITGTPFGGAATILLSIEGITLTAQSGQQSLSLNQPMLMARGTTITCTNTTNVANVSASASIYGYTVEP